MPSPWMTYLTRPNPRQSRLRKKQLVTRRKQVGEYELIHTIGRGSSGQVKLGVHKVTGEFVAIKMIPRRHLLLSPKVARSVERELAILQLVHHPHVIDLKQVLQDSSYIYFVSEYAEGGELYHLLADRGRLPESEAKLLFGQMAAALAWCHAHHICHRDLKPENILMDKQRKQLKIADFGMATMQSPTNLLRTSCGSPHYASPEIVRGKPYYGPSADVWSCGVILYIILTGQFPFDDEDTSHLLAKIKLGRYLPIPSYLSESAKDLIEKMLCIDPSKRITMNDVLCHPWVTDSVLVIEQSISTVDLDSPVVSGLDELDGCVWETLKVLWRDLGRDDLLAALTSRGHNVQKLTFCLLQQRMARMHGKEQPAHEADNLDTRHSESTTTITSDQTKETAESFALSAFRRLSYSFRNKIQSWRTNSVSSASEEEGEQDAYDCLSKAATLSSQHHDPFIISNPEKPLLSWTSQTDNLQTTSTIVGKMSPPFDMYPCGVDCDKLVACSNFYSKQMTSKKMHGAHTMDYRITVPDCRAATRFQINIRDDQIYISSLSRPNSSSAQSQCTASPGFCTLKSALTHKLRYLSLRHSLPLISALLLTVTTVKDAAKRTLLSCITGLRPANDLHSEIFTIRHCTCPSVSRSRSSSKWILRLLPRSKKEIYSIPCKARHEREAIAKVHKALFEHLDGHLEQQPRQNHQTIWCGQLPSANKRGKLRFLCRIDCEPKLSTRTVAGPPARISFILLCGSTTSMKAMLRQLKHALDVYEREAQEVAAANNWV